MISQVLAFVYFELTKFNTEGFRKILQSYEIYENINNSTALVSCNNLLDYNVFSIHNHSKIVANHASFIPLKYPLTNVIAQNLLEKNPLFYDL